MQDSKASSLQLPHPVAVAAAADGRNASPKREVPGEVGIWAFIFCDLSIFSLYFVTFLYERGVDRAAFAAGSEALNLTIGLVNTLVLLTSSLFVALAVQALREGNGASAQRYVLGAAAGGLMFIINKPIEWMTKLGEGLGPQHDHFFQLYYMMTGLHLLHVVVGMVVLTGMWRLARELRKAPTPRQTRFFENGATYWHLVDMIWLVLFALFYLLR
jgi:nitric oxide reductase NorE protein